MREVDEERGRVGEGRDEGGGERVIEDERVNVREEKVCEEEKTL